MDTLTGKYHLHPIIDHFTIALLATGILADIIAYLVVFCLSHRSLRVGCLADRLSATASVLLIPGAISAMLSRFTGESEAERVWDTAFAVIDPESATRFSRSYMLFSIN
jgi:uncharacterized membrane protein